MLKGKNSPTITGRSYDEFDRLLDEILKAEEDFTNEIRFFTQRLVDTETRIHKSVAKLMQMIEENNGDSKVM